MSKAIALLNHSETLDFDAMLFEADAIASRTAPRSLVFVAASNSIAAITGYLGFLRRGVVVMMIRPDMPQSQLNELLHTYEPQYLWFPTEAFTGQSFDIAHSSRNYSLFSTRYPQYDITPELALLLSTSGSTGSPKFVRLSYQNLRSNAESIASYQRITPNDRAITTLPFSYTYGISIINSHLLSGASIAVNEETIVSAKFWSLLENCKATNFGGVPYTYQILDKLKFHRMNLPSLRFISQAGGRLGEELQRKFAESCQTKNIEFYVMYGQTEATARMSWLPPQDALHKPGSIGIPIPGGSFEIHDLETGSVIKEPFSDGELVYRGENVSLGYATCKNDLNNPDERHGVLSTGDIARFDDDGYYYITGRLKRFLKIFGNRVSLDELESLLGKQGWECVATGEDNRLAIFTTTEEIEGVRDFLRTTTGLHPSAFSVEHIEAIPHTISGKIDYQSLPF